MVGGPPAIKSDVTPILNRDLARGEVIGALLALVILLSLFGRSRIIAIPVIFALAVTSVSLALVFLFSLLHPMALYLPNIISLFSLGLTLDYSLLVIYRYRYERKRGLDHQGAMAKVNTTALKTVSSSSLLVLTTLTFLLIIDVPFIRSISLGTLFVPLISYVAIHSLLPQLLDYFGDAKDFGAFSKFQESFSRSLSLRAIEKPIQSLVLSLLLLSSLGFGLKYFSLTPSSLTTLPMSTQSAQALELVTSRLGDGVITPHILIVKAHGADFTRLESAVHRLDDVVTTASEKRGDYFKIYVVSKYGLGTKQDQAFVNRLRNIDLERFGLTGAELYLAGAPAQGVDLLMAMRGAFPWIFLSILIALFIGLRKLLGTVVLATKALLMDFVSLVAVVGAVVILTKYGIGTYKLPQVEAWSLLLAIAILFPATMVLLGKWNWWRKS